MLYDQPAYYSSTSKPPQEKIEEDFQAQPQETEHELELEKAREFKPKPRKGKEITQQTLQEMDQLDDAEAMLLRDPFAEYHAMYKALSDTAEHKQLPTPNSKSSFKGRMAVKKKVSLNKQVEREKPPLSSGSLSQNRRNLQDDVWPEGMDPLMKERRIITGEL